MSRKPFTAEVFFGLSQPTSRVPFHLSPDGQKLVFAVQSQRRARDTGSDTSYTTTGIPRGMIGSRILMVDCVTGTVEEPFPPGSTSWGAQWSPDGSRLAAYVQADEGHACLGIWERASQKSRLYAHVHVRPFFGFEVPRWTPDSQSLVVKLVATQKREMIIMEEDASSEHVTVFSFIPGQEQDTAPLSGWADGYACDLALVESETGKVQQLAEDWRAIGWKVSPDGRSLAVLRYTKAEPKLQQLYFDLTLVPFDHGSPRLLARHIPQSYGICFQWSADSRFLAYTTRERGAQNRLYVVSANGDTEPRELSNLAEELELTQGDVEAPRWSEDGRFVYCLARRGCWEFATDGSSRRYLSFSLNQEVITWFQPPMRGTLWTSVPATLLYLTCDSQTKNSSLVRMNMRNGDTAILAELPMRPGGSAFEKEVNRDGSRMYFCLESSDQPAALWQFSSRDHHAKRFFSLNAHLDGVALGKSRLLTYRTLDGELRQAALLLPAGYTEGNTVPLIVVVYGGSTQSDDLHTFGVTRDLLHGQQLVSHGYAVLCPDIHLTDRDPLRQLPGQVLPAIHHVIDLGIADPKRLGLIGHSYGGYCALALLVQTNIFSAAVTSAGFYDLISTSLSMRENGQNGWLGWAESGQGRMGGSLWEKRESYIESNPIFYLDRIQTPLLLTCGSKDLVPPAQAEEVFVGLRRLGKRVELRRYEGEDHWPGRWGESSYRDLCARVLTWFDEYLSKEEEKQA